MDWNIPNLCYIILIYIAGGGGGGDTKMVNPWLGGGIKFFKFISNFQIGIEYQILGG